MPSPLPQLHHAFDVCIIGGGMAGLCAAIAAARNGAKTCLVHDRPVLGGNASSEVRMWICGAHGKHNKEAGILEEIQLENCYRNPSLNYSVWDSVLYGKAKFQPNLTLFLDTTCNDAAMEGDRIAAVTAWQMTSQTWHTIRAKLFLDCSGDSILAPFSGAHTRLGREGRGEFDEDIEPVEADRKTMGNTLLIQLRKTDRPQTFIPPKWAYKFTRPEDLPHRIDGVQAANFWWIELGGLKDTIHDASAIRDDLMRVVYGVWDYIKNHAPERSDAATWAIEWIGSLPGKRESRRYVGDYTLTQNDIRAGGRFPDIVAYGGWTMDDHHPAGLLYPGKPTLFHPAPSPYGIPYRCLYSHNVTNLLCAGRNISVTHAALSSTRVMATCAILGQAAGTAAALCIQHACNPRDLYPARIGDLQAILMDDDCWLPGLKRPISSLANSAILTTSQDSGLTTQDLLCLLDGIDRDRENEPHGVTLPLNTPIEYRWKEAVHVAGVRLVFDSNLLNDKRMPCSYPQHSEKSRVPGTLIKSFRLEALTDNNSWVTVHREENNYQRLVRISFNCHTKALRLIPESTWAAAPSAANFAAAPTARVFGFEPFAEFQQKIPIIPEGPAFSQLIAQLNPKDLAPPDSGQEANAETHHSPSA